MPIESPFPTSSSTSNLQTSERRDTAMSDNAASDVGLQNDAARGADAVDAGATYADDLIGRIAQGAHQAIDRLAEGAVPHVNRLQESMSGASASLQERTDRAREQADEWAESLRCTVRENPLASLGVALAVGLLVARLAR